MCGLDPIPAGFIQHDLDEMLFGDPECATCVSAT